MRCWGKDIPRLWGKWRHGVSVCRGCRCTGEAQWQRGQRTSHRLGAFARRTLLTPQAIVAALEPPVVKKKNKCVIL